MYTSWVIGLEVLKQEKNNYKQCTNSGLPLGKKSKVDTNLNTNLVKQLPITRLKA